MIEIRCLDGVGFDALFSGFESAFSDYAIRFNKDEVWSMLIRRGYEPRLSFAAFDGDKIVAFTLNGIGQFNGIPTAYDTGTATVKDYRGQGLARRIFDYSLPFLKDAGIRQYLLEVLQDNRQAIIIYRSIGFETTREFDCFRQNLSEIRNLVDARPDAGCRIAAIGADAVGNALRFCDFSASWQNSVESIDRGRSQLTCLGAFLADRLAGYCVFDRATGDLTQIAVDTGLRCRGIGTRLLQSAVSMMKTDFIKVLNIPATDIMLHRFLSGKNIPLLNKQFEMILPI